MTPPIVPLPNAGERTLTDNELNAPSQSTGAFLVATAPTGGRRDIDEGRVEVVEFLRPIRDGLFWLFGILLEPKAPHKPSITRVSWWIVVLVGIGMFYQEITHHYGAHAPSNAAWQAWAIAFTVCGTAVGFPKAVDLWKNGGAAAIGAMGAALRDRLPEKEPTKKDDERHDA